MAGLFTMTVCRDPRAAPAALDEAPALHTHPPRGTPASGSPAARPLRAAGMLPALLRRCGCPPASSSPPRGEPAEASLHDRLFAAWERRDWASLVATARAHLAASGPAPRLHPITEAAIAFFRPGEREIGPGDTERFLHRIGEERLTAYLDGTAAADRARMADDALALHCLGVLGGAPFDYASALRASEALAVSAKLVERDGEGRISPDLIRGIGEMDVFLPDWSFHLDVCRRSDSDEGWPVEGALERRLRKAERRKAEPPPEGDCDCRPGEDPCLPPDPCCAEVRYYIADLLELRHWTHRYRPGDLAYIENVAAGEQRTREHEMRRTREVLTEEETSERRAERRDFQVSDRGAFRREIDRQRASSQSAEASATGTYDAGAYSATVSATASFARSSSEALREAQETAVETVKKAVLEIEKETRTRRTERMTTEETEKNLHAFTNPTADPLVTKFFWVTQECGAQLFSYGKQMIAEFIVPAPASLYEHLVRERREAEIAARIRPPRGTEPVAPTLDVTAGDLHQDNYQGLCTRWGIEDPPAWPPPSMTLREEEIDDWPRGTSVPLDTLHFSIPPGFEAVGMSLSGKAEYNGEKGAHKVELACTGGTVHFSHEDGDKPQMSFVPHLTGQLDVTIVASNTEYVHAAVTLLLQRLPGTLELWQTTLYERLKEAYEAALAEYEKRMEPWDAYRDAKDALRRELVEAERGRHPFYNREIEAAELKRAVIYLMCQDFSVDGAMIRRSAPCGFPEIDRTAADRAGYEWYFWDRLMDWKRMSYAFFDYFWNPVCDWPARFDPDEPDALFRAFRRAGYARVLVPVSRAMHKDFLWYLATHEKWGQAGPPFSDTDPRWRNVVFELSYANDAAMTPREGTLDVVAGASVATVKDSGRYWSLAGTGVPDPALVALDLNRELYVGGEVYRVIAIALHPGSPAYSATQPSTGWWELTLDRPYGGATATGQLYAMGAQAVAPEFRFDLPTDLVWTGDRGICLPSYPLAPCVP